jgi:cephalosporin hydroxylase
MIAELIERMGLPTDKTTTHSYGEFYDRELAPYRGRPIRLLEIGVDRGGSLRLWDAYFKGHAEIVGIDIDPSRVEPAATWVADVLAGDAYKESGMPLGDFDVIIDDGPHTLDSMLSLIRLYAPRLNSGGLMVIEDVQDFCWTGKLADEVSRHPGYRCRAADFRKSKGRYDDILFVIERPHEFRF